MSERNDIMKTLSIKENVILSLRMIVYIVGTMQRVQDSQQIKKNIVLLDLVGLDRKCFCCNGDTAV